MSVPEIVSPVVARDGRPMSAPRRCLSWRPRRMTKSSARGGKPGSVPKTISLGLALPSDALALAYSLGRRRAIAASGLSLGLPEAPASAYLLWRQRGCTILGAVLGILLVCGPRPPAQVTVSACLGIPPPKTEFILGVSQKLASYGSQCHRHCLDRNYTITLCQIAWNSH